MKRLVFYAFAASPCIFLFFYFLCSINFPYLIQDNR